MVLHAVGGRCGRCARIRQIAAKRPEPVERVLSVEELATVRVVSRRLSGVERSQVLSMLGLVTS